MKTLDMQFSGRVWRVAGALFCIGGLLGDCLAGFLLLYTGSGRLLLWHLLCALPWVEGGNLLARPGEMRRAAASRWRLTALLLGVGLFPGLGLCACTLACIAARTLFTSAVLAGASPAERESQDEGKPVGTYSLRKKLVLPFVDDVREGDTEARRAVVADLSRVANPATTQLLRQLLCDAEAEIRCDASIALNCLDDKMSHGLHQAFADWRANPADSKCALTLINRCHHYATSNVLDAQSQRFYLVLVRDLLQQVLATGEQEDAELWLTLADVRQRLGDVPGALQDALCAAHMQPEVADAPLLAMDLALRCHAWDILYALAAQHTDLLPGCPLFWDTRAPAGPLVLEGERYE